MEKYIKNQPIFSKTIENIKNNNKISHAYIVETNGNKQAFSLVKTMIFNIMCCKNTNINNDNLKNTIENESNVDLKIIRPLGNVIKKEQMIDVQNDFSKSSITNSHKVYVITDGDKMNLSSSNTILKFLEEPPTNVTAIIMVENINQLLKTIISRCQIIYLNKDKEELGNINDKIDFITRSINLENNIFEKKENIEILFDFIKELENNGREIITDISSKFLKYFKNKNDVSSAILIMLYFYKDILNTKCNVKIEIFDEYLDLINEISFKNSINVLINKIESINECRKNLEQNANISLAMDKLIIEMTGEII